MLAVLRREFNSYFSSAIGYVYLVVFYVVTGIPFSLMMLSYSTELAVVFSWTYSVLMFIVPILTMRLLSEDKKQKTDQALLTAPVNLSAIVLGKYFAAMAIFLIGIAVIVAYAVVLSIFAVIDWSVVLGSILGIALLGAALIAIGMFISSLTENQVIAAVGALAISMVLMMLNVIISSLPVGFFQDLVSSIAFYNRYSPFTAGVLDVSNVLYFVSIAVVFNFLTMRVLEKRRWS